MSKHKPGFRAGLVLEELLSEELDALNVDHQLTRGDRENIEQRVDLRVTPYGVHARPYEFQLTLREKNRRKMRDFVLAAMKNKRRGLRIYLEVITSKFTDLRYIARRVAWAIKYTVTNFRDFEPFDLLGLRFRPGRSKKCPKLERFSLLERVGCWATEQLAKERENAINDI